jgi:spore maturation protein CgeB
MDIAFYGSSLVSSYWNGAATDYRGILSALAPLGYRVTFHEPDAFDRQNHRDIDPADYAKAVVYPAIQDGLQSELAKADQADIVVKASGVGVFDHGLLAGILAHSRADALRIFWDVDAAATLEEIRNDPADPIRVALPQLDAVFTYGGGPPVMDAYTAFGARLCGPIYNALDPATHHPAAADPRFAADLSFLANRLPDRERRVEQFFLAAAGHSPTQRFLLGGNGWHDKRMPSNVTAIGHVGTRDHNAFTALPRPPSTSPGTAWPASASPLPPESSRAPGPLPASSRTPGKASRCSSALTMRFSLPVMAATLPIIWPA